MEDILKRISETEVLHDKIEKLKVKILNIENELENDLDAVETKIENLILHRQKLVDLIPNPKLKEKMENAYDYLTPHIDNDIYNCISSEDIFLNFDIINAYEEED